MKGDNKSDFAHYYDHFKKVPTLSAVEERHLIEIAQSGDQSAYRKFVNSNIRLVMYRVLQYCAHSDPRAMDLVSEGTLGLMRAVDLFDVSKNFRFSTYAVWWINCYIRRSIRFFQKERSINLPTLHLQYEQACKALRNFLDKEPTEEEILAYLGWTPQTFRLYKKFKSDPKLIGHLKGGSPNIPTGREGPEDIIHRKDMQDKIDNTLKKLSPVEEDIIRRYYGLGYDKHTYDQVGRFYGMTKEWVRQTETKSLRKLFILMGEKKIPTEVIEKSRQKEAKKKLLKFLSKLTPIEEDIIRRKNGIGYKIHTSQQICRFYRMPIDWIHEKERSAVSKLQDFLGDEKIDPSSEGYQKKGLFFLLDDPELTD